VITVDGTYTERPEKLKSYLFSCLGLPAGHRQDRHSAEGFHARE
jgi:hypothetical protein